MNPITIPNISIPTIGIPTIGIPSVGFPSASGGGGLSWPAGMKEHIKAWYDPKKQGMTNYDVIEAYTEDFTTWTVNKEGVIANVTSKSITITNVLNSNPLIYTYGTFSVRLRIDGLKNGQGIFFGDNKEYTISENGIYDIDTTENIRTNFIGECNITITQLPTSILKDFSGNGNHAYLYGGKGKLNSGMGLYKVDFTTYINKNNILDIKPNSFITNAGASYINSYYSQIANNIPTCNIKVANLNGSIKYSYKDTDYTDLSVIIEKDGTYNLPISYKVNENKPTGFSINSSTKVTITQIPDYPDQLCYDGKMYAVAYDMPILTDYTVMAERTWFENKNIFLAKGNITTEAKYAFIFERFKPDGVMAVQSFGAWNDVISTTDSCISYLTKNKYNGIDIRSGIGADDDMLSIGGALNKGNIELTSVCCHGAIIIADRSFTEEEINWLKQNWDKI